VTKKPLPFRSRTLQKAIKIACKIFMDILRSSYLWEAIVANYEMPFDLRFVVNSVSDGSVFAHSIIVLLLICYLKSVEAQVIKFLICFIYFNLRPLSKLLLGFNIALSVV
jgi:hypothetical protein